MIPNIPIPTMNMSSADEVKTRLLNSESGITGSAALSSMGMKAASRTAATPNPATTRVASQSYPSPTHESESKRDDRGRYGGGPEVIYLHPEAPGSLVEHDGQREEREDAERQIDVEDPTPGEVVRDPPPHRGSYYAGEREDAEKYALVLRPASRVGEYVRHRSKDVGEDHARP